MEKFKKLYLRIVRILSNTIDNLILVAFLILFLIGAYGVMDTYSIYAVAQSKGALKYKPEDGKVLLPELKDNIAWLSMDDTNIDYPIMQGDDNEEYVNKDAYGAYSLSGAIFLDYRNAADFTDTYNLVYGHHMEKQMMFGALDQWLEEDFFEEHTTGTLTTTDRIYHLDVYAIVETSATAREIFLPGAFGLEDILAHCDSNAVHINEAVTPTHLLAMSTCKYPDTDDRTVLVCEMTETYRGETVLDQTKQEEIRSDQEQVGSKVYMNIEPVEPNSTWFDTLLRKIGWK